MTNIKDLSDYPAFKKLAASLHRLDASGQGAAIMIGAGFSRSAAHHVDGQKKMPLWNDFAARLFNQLNPGEPLQGFLDPLRVAQEYSSYFGTASLNDQIRSAIDDNAWRTGPLYEKLLGLPWSEVLTTNWDTLLERATKTVQGRFYSTVIRPSDLTWATSPRIVKLHGTIGATEAFTATQEDYRTYPTKFAPFVNFARQVFIEHELCLLGFSGDDPNFLNWAGWVRDNLANHTRTIYLVGALNLSPSKRKHLERMGISPIDLWDAAKGNADKDLIHKEATSLFIESMVAEGEQKKEANKWPPGALESLLTNSLGAIPTSEHGDVLSEALDFPLANELPQINAPFWPNPVIHFPKPRSSYPGIDKRIAELIEFARPDGEDASSSALLRLFPLCNQPDFLTKAEKTKLAQMLWGEPPNYQDLPKIKDLYPHAYLILPSTDANQVEDLVCQRLFDGGESVLAMTQKEKRGFSSTEHNEALVIFHSIALASTIGSSSVFPKPIQAIALFDRITKWRPLSTDSDLLDLLSSFQGRLVAALGNALSYAICPALPDGAVSVDRFEALSKFITQVEDAHSALPAFIRFIGVNEAIEKAVEKMIEQNLSGSSFQQVSYATIALEKWMEQPEGTSSPCFQRLVTRLMRNIESRQAVGLQELLTFARKLVISRLLTDEWRKQLMDAIPDIFNAYDYKNIEPNSREAISASTIRGACAKTAISLIEQFPKTPELQNLLDKARLDPLPEVRFAFDLNLSR